MAGHAHLRRETQAFDLLLQFFDVTVTFFAAAGQHRDETPMRQLGERFQERGVPLEPREAPRQHNNGQV